MKHGFTETLKLVEHLVAKESESQLVTKPELKTEYTTCIIDLVVINASGMRHVNQKKL